jgi:hypothetical protein
MAFLTTITQVASTYWLPLIVVAVVARLAYNRYHYGVSDIPGPFFASVSHAWLFVHYLRRRGVEEYDLHKKYRSPLLRLGPDTISVSDAEAVRIIYGWKPVFAKVMHDGPSEEVVQQQRLICPPEPAVHLSGCHRARWHRLAERVFHEERVGASGSPPPDRAHLLAEHPDGVRASG